MDNSDKKEEKRRIRCLFCSRPLRFRDSVSPARCSCGSRLTRNPDDLKYLKNIADLEREGKIRQEKDLYGYYPYSRRQLEAVFTAKQINTIEKRVRGEDLTKADWAHIRAIRRKVKNTKENYSNIKFLMTFEI